MQEFYDICFTSGCVMPKYIGWHIYISSVSDAAYIHLFLDGVHNMEFPDTKWWITEFADVNGDVYTDAVLVSEFRKRPWIERWAYFCNRAKGDEPWYPKDWNVKLIDWVSEQPTEIGRWYACSDVHNVFMPIVSR
jgi:hypothetical protein